MHSSSSGIRENDDDEKRRYPEITLSEEVRTYLSAQNSDFRICTSCGGPILLPVSVKRPKPTDITVPVGKRTLYISRYQASFLRVIDCEMMPRFLRRYDR
jgi:hypothetical protein